MIINLFFHQLIVFGQHGQIMKLALVILESNLDRGTKQLLTKLGEVALVHQVSPGIVQVN